MRNLIGNNSCIDSAGNTVPPHTRVLVLPQRMFNSRKYKTRLPTKKRHPSAFHEEVKQVDEKSKEAMKRYANDKRYVKVSDIKEGDAVLVKQQKRNKLTPAYDPQPYQVMQRNGSKIKATRNDHQITRHVNHFKRLKGSRLQVEKMGPEMWQGEDT